MPDNPPLRSRRRLAALCLAAAPWLAQCAGDDLGKLVGADRITTTSRDAGAAARLISEYRVSRGLGPVVADSQLNEAASRQARAVAEAGRLSHGDFQGRMDEEGIRGASAENLSAGAADVDAAIRRWKASPGHDRNLLMTEARRIGLARADSPGHGYRNYWALVLAQ